MSEKVKYELEFVVKSSPSLLYSYISTPSGLGQWFADNVNSRGEIFNFMWDGAEEEAKLVSKKTNHAVKFKWVEDEDPNAFFEMKIQIDDLTNDVALLVTDFAEEDEIDEAKLLWEAQVENLHSIIG